MTRISLRLLVTAAIFFVPALAINLVLPLASASVNRQSDDLYLSISLVKSEHSRDSNSSKSTFVVQGNKISYDQTFGGYRPAGSKPVHKQYTLTRRQIADLKRLLEEKHLMNSSSLILPPGSSPYTSYDLTAELRWRGKTATIKVSGPLKSLDSNETKNGQLYQDADALFQLLKATLDQNP